MKKHKWLLILLIICVCFYAIIKIFSFLFNPVVSTLPKYKSYEGYISDGFQDYTIYREYRYSSKSPVMFFLEHNMFFDKVASEDVEQISGYLGNFEAWLSHTDFQDRCNFTEDMIDISDYWYVSNKWAEDEDEDSLYYDYDVYYFDVDTKTLFYIHNNI